MPEINGRVAEVYVEGITAELAEGDPIFRLDSNKQEAALDVARRRVAEVEASMIMAEADVAAAEGQVQEAKGAYDQAL